MLGFNLWMMLVGAPALHGGAGGWRHAALALSPLLVLAVALVRPTPAMLRFVYPAALLTPLVLSRPLMAERTLGPAGVLAVVVSVGAWFLVAGGRPQPGAGPSRAARMVGAGLSCLFVTLVTVVHFHPGVVGWIDATWPGRAAEARVLLSLLGFMGWMGAAGVGLRILSRPAATAALAMLTLMGCDATTDSASPGFDASGRHAAADSPVVAEVDGRPITLPTLQAAVTASEARAPKCWQRTAQN